MGVCPRPIVVVGVVIHEVVALSRCCKPDRRCKALLRPVSCGGRAGTWPLLCCCCQALTALQVWYEDSNPCFNLFALNSSTLLIGQCGAWWTSRPLCWSLPPSGRQAWTQHMLSQFGRWLSLHTEKASDQTLWNGKHLLGLSDSTLSRRYLCNDIIVTTLDSFNDTHLRNMLSVQRLNQGPQNAIHVQPIAWNCTFHPKTLPIPQEDVAVNQVEQDEDNLEVSTSQHTKRTSTNFSMCWLSASLNAGQSYAFFGKEPRQPRLSLTRNCPFPLAAYRPLWWSLPKMPSPTLSASSSSSTVIVHIGWISHTEKANTMSESLIDLYFGPLTDSLQLIGDWCVIR